jgi:hypothetical protein
MSLLIDRYSFPWIHGTFKFQSNEWVMVMVYMYKATFNNISDISWQSILLMEETRLPGENHRPVTSH